MSEPDPISWIRELGVSQPWEYDLVQAVIRVYLKSTPKRQHDARRALRGIDREAALWVALRSSDRRN
jgi:hypothetical protein